MNDKFHIKHNTLDDLMREVFEILLASNNLIMPTKARDADIPPVHPLEEPMSHVTLTLLHRKSRVAFSPTDVTSDLTGLGPRSPGSSEGEKTAAE